MSLQIKSLLIKALIVTLPLAYAPFAAGYDCRIGGARFVYKATLASQNGLDQTQVQVGAFVRSYREDNMQRTASTLAKAIYDSVPLMPFKNYFDYAPATMPHPWSAAWGGGALCGSFGGDHDSPPAFGNGVRGSGKNPATGVLGIAANDWVYLIKPAVTLGYFATSVPDFTTAETFAAWFTQVDRNGSTNINALIHGGTAELQLAKSDPDNWLNSSTEGDVWLFFRIPADTWGVALTRTLNGNPVHAPSYAPGFGMYSLVAIRVAHMSIPGSAFAAITQ
jgi:hypothetical protein